MSAPISETSEKSCPECQGLMGPVKLIDRSHGGYHHSLDYTAEHETRSFWKGQYPVAGQVSAWMCSQCGRITLYGTPTRTSNPRTDDVP